MIADQIKLSRDIINLTKKFSNDFDLGGKVRELVNDYKKKEKPHE